MFELSKSDVLQRESSKMVLQQLINGGITTRAQISRDLGLNKSTVSSIYDDLKDYGIVTEVGEGEASKVGGRRPTRIKLNAEFGYTISLDLAYHRIHFMVNYLDASVISREDINIEGDSIEQIVSKITDRIDYYGRTTSSVNGLLGIGISIHGIVKDGQITYSPFLDMGDKDIKKEFEYKYNVPVYLENESNLTGLYVRDFLNNEEIKNLIAISIHKGIGSGIILNNGLFRGFNGEAGEVGRTLTKTNDGHYATIESICSEDAIINYVVERSSVEKLSRQDLIRLLDKKDKLAFEAMDRFISEISMLIFNVAMNFDTKSIYIGSPLMQEKPEIFGLISEAVRNFGKSDIELILLDDSDKACLLGACSLVTHEVLGISAADLNFGS